MPSKLKNLIRARMDETGESYAAALRYVRAQEEKSNRKERKTIADRQLQTPKGVNYIAPSVLGVVVVG